MSEPCPNAKAVKSAVMKKFKCEPFCAICKGKAYVQECPECDGCGLRKGGIRCETCQCYGKVPAPNPELVCAEPVAARA
jgi:hypothetical protein